VPPIGEGPHVAPFKGAKCSRASKLAQRSVDFWLLIRKKFRFWLRLESKVEFTWTLIMFPLIRSMTREISEWEMLQKVVCRKIPNAWAPNIFLPKVFPWNEVIPRTLALCVRCCMKDTDENREETQIWKVPLHVRPTAYCLITDSHPSCTFQGLQDREKYLEVIFLMLQNEGVISFNW
jgi:hypothetical protein